MMAGAASTNPLLLVVAVGLILAWKVSGYIGTDYWLLRWIGTPWGNEPESVRGVTGYGRCQKLLWVKQAILPISKQAR